MSITTHTHWHQVISDIGAAIRIVGSGLTLHEGIQEYKLKNDLPKLALQCGRCLMNFYVGVESLRHNHLTSAAPPAIACHDCGHDGNHHYNGLLQ